jgi:hypothetical protein
MLCPAGVRMARWSGRRAAHSQKLAGTAVVADDSAFSLAKVISSLPANKKHTLLR